MDGLRRDLGYAVRMLVKTPAITLIAVLTLALGIGANTAIFSIIDGMLLRPLPFTQPDRLVAMWTMLPHWGREAASGPDFQDWRKAAALEDAAAMSRTSMNLGDVSEPQRLIAGRITANMLPVLKLQPLIGRTFSEVEDRPGGPSVAMLGRSFWQRQFGGRPDVLGKTVQLSGVPYEVIGVMPAGINALGEADLWVPLALRPDMNRRADFLHVVGRLKPRVTLEQAQSQMAALARHLSEQYPDTNKDVGIQVAALHSDLVRDARPLLLSLWAAVGFVLLIVVTNIANLLLARGAARSKEIAIRVAMGAKPARLFRQWVTESVLLSVVGGGLGIAMAYWGLSAFVKLLPWHIPDTVSLQVNGRTLLFALGVTLGAGFLFGSLPALHAARATVFDLLKEGARGSQVAAKHRLRRVLAVAEIAISLLLLVGAGLMVRTMYRLQNVDPGFRGDGLLTFRVGLPPKQYKPQQQVRFFDELLSRVSAFPQVVAAAGTSDLYFSDGNYLSFSIQGRTREPQQPWDANTRTVTPDFLKAMGLRLVRGRMFTSADREGSQPVALINERLTRQYLGHVDPIGQHIAFDTSKGVPNWREIVGVIADVRQETLDKEPYAELIVPQAQSPQTSLAIVVRTGARPEAVLPEVRRELHALDPNVPLYSVKTMQDVMSQSLADRTMQTWLLGAFAGLALLLAAMGIYGVMAQTVMQRTPEFGLRMALGAQRRQILSLVLGNGFRLVLVGLAVGVAGSLLLTRFLAAFVFGISTHDPSTILSVGLLLSAVALLACYIPARRAMQVDPMVALRQQ